MEDELMGMVLQLAGWVEGVAPEVWAIMVRQALLKGIQNIFGAVVALVIAIYLSRVCKKCYEQYKKEDSGYDILSELGVAFSGIGAVAGAAAFCGMLTDAFGYLFNPQYYALQGIITLFK